MNRIDYLLDRKFTLRLNNGQLRIIAMVTMLMDHFAFMIINNGILYGYEQEVQDVAVQTEAGKKWVIVYIILRTIGRISFPIFCFLLVEGFKHTSNLFKYFIRMFAVALLSEIPFNLMCGNSVVYPEKQNSIITLLMGLIVITLVDKLGKFRILQHNIVKFLQGGIIFAAGYIAQVFHFDYGAIAILLIVWLYIFYYDKNVKLMGLIFAAFAMSFVGGDSLRYFGFGALAVIPIYIYNGKIGDMHKYMNGYYMFYPVHILILYGVVFITYIK